MSLHESSRDHFVCTKYKVNRNHNVHKIRQSTLFLYYKSFSLLLVFDPHLCQYIKSSNIHTIIKKHCLLNPKFIASEQNWYSITTYQTILQQLELKPNLIKNRFALK